MFQCDACMCLCFFHTVGFLGLLSILSLALCQSDGDPSLIITPVVNGEFLKFDHRIRWPAGRSLSKSVKQTQGENHFDALFFPRTQICHVSGKRTLCPSPRKRASFSAGSPPSPRSRIIVVPPASHALKLSTPKRQTLGPTSVLLVIPTLLPLHSTPKSTLTSVSLSNP